MEEIKINETHIKGQIKDYLAFKNIFNYPVLQGMGAYKGIPDRIMHYQGRVVYLEIKTPKGKLSEGQEDFWRQCENDGIDYWVIRSIEDLETLLITIREGE